MISGLVRWWRLKFGKAPLMSPGEFTRLYADFLSRADPGLEVGVVGDLELRLGSQETNDRTYLYNAYEAYRRLPDRAAEVIAHFAGTNLDIATREAKVDRTCIVPVIKDRAWLEENQKLIDAHGGGDGRSIVFDEFGRDLVVLYAVDSEKSIFYLNREHMDELNMPREELRILAVANLKRLLPQISRLGSDGLFILRVDGTYEASLLLLDAIWTRLQPEIQGELVVAIPTRDCLIVTGTERPEHLARLRKTAEEAWKAGPYSLTPKPFVYRGGQFRPLDE